MTSRQTLALLPKWVLELLAPTHCAACEASTRHQLFCAACDEQFVAAKRKLFPTTETAPSPSLAGVRLVTLGPFAGPLSIAVKRLKYAGRADLADLLAVRWWRECEVLAASLERPLVVPVPLHPSRLAARGYNQSGLVASRLARLAGLRVDHQLLVRVRETRQQAKLCAQQRHENLRRAFRATGRARRLAGRALVLVDDVVTTGATAAACIEAAGAAGLHVTALWTLAYAPGHDR